MKKILSILFLMLICAVKTQAEPQRIAVDKLEGENIWRTPYIEEFVREMDTTPIPAGARSTPLRAFAPPADRVIYVQPIQVCDRNGNNCANPSQILYEAETDKIWAQASVDISYLPITRYLHPNDTTNFCGVFNFPGGGAHPDSYVVNMWFVKSICSSSSFLGFAVIGGNGITIADSVFTRNAVDTIAHEIGHNTGLDHVGSASNLMAPSSAVNNINNIFPDGTQRGQLDAGQITAARQSSLVRQLTDPSPQPQGQTSSTNTQSPALSEAFAYPNPSVTETTTVRASLGLVDSVDITIYDLSGVPVHSATLPGNPSGSSGGTAFYEYRWAESKPNGIYIAVIQGKRAGGTVLAKTKFAVAR